MFTAVVMTVDLIVPGVAAGVFSSISAATPATWGVAMLVPSAFVQSASIGLPRLVPVARQDAISLPGAVTSGFARPSGVGPTLEKSVMWSLSSEAATVIALAARPGQRRCVS